MTRKRKRGTDKSVPQWVVTYGDMMSLLLCFFILLAAFSELKQEREYRKVIQSIQEAFGYQGGVGISPTDMDPENAAVTFQAAISAPGRDVKRVQDSTIESMIGQHTMVETIHEGLKFTIGGTVTFDPGSDVLRPQARRELLQLAELLQGRNNRIVVRGHASGADRDPTGQTDYRDLSYMRAKAVGEFLRDVGGIREQVLSYEAMGDTEPAAVRRYTPDGQAVNRRVQIILTEVMVDETHPDALFTGRERLGSPD